MRDWKVLISGMGIAGPALAHELLRAGCVPTLVDQAAQFRAAGYATDFWGHGYDVIERMGLLPEVLAAGYRVRALRLVDRSGRRVGGFDASLFHAATAGRFTTLQRGDLSAILIRALRGRPGLHWGSQITELRMRDDGVSVRLDQGPEQLFDIVVGADGLHSRVRELAFGPTAQFEHGLGYVVAAFEALGYRPRDHDEYVAHAAPGRHIARFAMRGDRTMFLFVVADPNARAMAAAGIQTRKAYLRERFSDVGWECPAILDALRHCAELCFDTVSQIHMPHWSNGRVALLGESAFSPSLLAGQGASLAILGAHVLAGELARADQPEEAFARYEAQLRPLIARKQRAAVRSARAFAPETFTGVLLRRWATRLVALPGAARFIMDAALSDAGALPEYEGLARPLQPTAATSTPQTDATQSSTSLTGGRPPPN